MAISLLLPFISASTVVLIATWVYWRWKNRRLLELASKIPGPPALPLIGNALLFKCEPEELMPRICDMMTSYGDHVRFWLGPDLNVVVKHPDDCRLLLSSNKTTLKGPVYKIMAEFIGPGILSGGPTWRSHRKIATPTYNKKSVQIFNQVFNDEAQDLIRMLRAKNPHATIDIFKDVLKITTICVCQTLIGLSKAEAWSLPFLDAVLEETEEIYGLVLSKMIKPWYHIKPIYMLIGGEAKQRLFLEHIMKMGTAIVEFRRKEIERRGLTKEDLDTEYDDFAASAVDRYILSGELTENELIMEAFTLFTTSQEAAAKIASGVFQGLAYRPDWQEKVYREILEVVGPEPRDVNYEDFKRMPFLDMAYKETVRYYPIAAMIQRTVVEEIDISIGTIPVGTSLAIPLHALHRDPNHWEEPDKFKPERFLPENVAKRNPNCYIPFSLGPMDCLGRVYATSLIKTLVVHVLRNFELAAEGKMEDLPISVAISVKSADGYNVRVRQRKRDDFQRGIKVDAA